MVHAEPDGDRVCHQLADYSANALLDHVLAPDPDHV